MRIHIWIKRSSLDDFTYFLSDNFGHDREMKLEIWYHEPDTFRDHFLEVSITPEQYAKLEDIN
jgi:hypothetical protein